jgi:hypothetical protein
MSESIDGPNVSSEHSASEAAPERATFFAKHPFLVYTALRIGVLLVVAAVLYLLGARGMILILLAFPLSAVASYIFLASMRDEVGSRMGGFFGRLNERIEESKRSEDDFIDHEAAAVREEQTRAADTGADTDGHPSPDVPKNSAG